MSAPKSRAAVLKAAERAFAEKGFDGARIADIARKARLNKAMIYYFFKSKKQLCEAVLDDLYADLHGAIRAATKSLSDPVELFFAMVTGYFDFVNQRRTYPQIIQREVTGGGKFLSTIAQHLHPMYRDARRTIEAAIRCGRFRRVDPGQLLLSAVGLIVFYFNSARIFGMVARTNPLSPAKVALRKREIVELLKRGVLTRPAKTRGGN